MAQLVLVAALLAAYFVIARRWPREQVVHVSLGDGAARVERLAIGYGDDRGAAFSYAKGTAPRIVTHEAKLPDGDYVVDVEVTAGSATATVHRRVHLESGGSTTVDVSRDVPAE
jgi:hypothetical protein